MLGGNNCHIDPCCCDIYREPCDVLVKLITRQEIDQ